MQVKRKKRKTFRYQSVYVMDTDYDHLRYLLFLKHTIKFNVVYTGHQQSSKYLLSSEE